MVLFNNSKSCSNSFSESSNYVETSMTDIFLDVDGNSLGPTEFHRPNATRSIYAGQPFGVHPDWKSD